MSEQNIQLLSSDTGGKSTMTLNSRYEAALRDIQDWLFLVFVILIVFQFIGAVRFWIRLVYNTVYFTSNSYPSFRPDYSGTQ